MSFSSTTFWPYEQRFELLTKGDLRALPVSAWEDVFGSLDAAKETVLEGCSHFLQPNASLFVFANRAVYVSSAPEGILAGAQKMVELAGGLEVEYAAIERRYPLGSAGTFAWNALRAEESVDRWPLRREPTKGATLHYWGGSHPTHAPSTLILLMHDLSGRCDLQDVTAILQSELPGLSITSQRYEPTGFSLNGAEGEAYVTMQYTPGLYASFECSLLRWDVMDSVIARILDVCKPEIVAPLWHGRPLYEVLESEDGEVV